MSLFNLPWLELSVVFPLLGALVVGRIGDSYAQRRWALVVAAMTFVSALLAWQDFAQGADPAGRIFSLQQMISGRTWLLLDSISAPLPSMVSLLYCLTMATTLRTKLRRFSFSWTLFSEGVVLALLSCREPWLIVALSALSTLPPYIELRDRRRPTRVYVLHMAAFVLLLVLGELLVAWEGEQQLHSLWAIAPLLVAVFIRSGMAPVHCWMTDLFDHVTLGTSLLYVAPISGAYLAVRLVLPTAPVWVINSLGIVSLVTAVYAAGMALVQTEARRFFCYLFLSHSALVLVGLETMSIIGLTGALCMWLSVGLSLGGFGLTIRALEARRGRLSLTDYQGLYEHTPALAICFFLTGMASVGFPGTLGFIGAELLVDGAVEEYPYVGIAVVVAAALNGIAVVQAYFRLFTGTRHFTSVPLGIGIRERFAVLSLAALILLGGVVPQFNVASRFHAAEELLQQRDAGLRKVATLHDPDDAARLSKDLPR